MSQDLAPSTIIEISKDATAPRSAGTTVADTQSHPASSQRKLDSSRANGAKSHGPATPAGLQKCTTAAALQINHGMLAKTVVLHGESESRFIAILQSFVDAYRPITEPEHAAVNKMVVAYWRQMRTWSIQKLDFDRETARQDPADSESPAPFRATLAFRALCQDGSNALALAHRYETTYERQFTRAIHDLAVLKTLRDPTAGLDHHPSGLGSTTWENPAV